MRVLCFGGSVLVPGDGDGTCSVAPLTTSQCIGGETWRKRTISPLRCFETTSCVCAGKVAALGIIICLAHGNFLCGSTLSCFCERVLVSAVSAFGATILSLPRRCCKGVLLCINGTLFGASW